METVKDTWVDWGAATMPLAGANSSGDRYLVKPFPGGCLLAAVDGLGHGAEAASAAELAVHILEKSPAQSVIQALNSCHEALHSTRGVVMSLASFNAEDRTMTWLGVGNVEGVLLRGDAGAVPPFESLMLRRGVVGQRVEKPQATVIPVAAGDTLVFATDGVRQNFVWAVNRNDPVQQLAERILADHAKGTDDALVLVARYRPWQP